MLDACTKFCIQILYRRFLIQPFTRFEAVNRSIVHTRFTDLYGRKFRYITSLPSNERIGSFDKLAEKRNSLNNILRHRQAHYDPAENACTVTLKYVNMYYYYFSTYRSVTRLELSEKIKTQKLRKIIYLHL